jgi:signal transduction histidine kinase
LQRSHHTLHALLSRLERTREEERTRLARDVHDELGQNLTAVKMDLRWMERRLEAIEDLSGLDPVKARTVSAIGVVDDTTALVQDLAAQLRPSVLDRLGLGPAIQGEMRRFQSRVGIQCKMSLPVSFPSLAPSVATAVFRILQECLTNVARHAGASRIVVRLGMRGNDVLLRVLDNGSGISASALRSGESLGLLGMKERAAGLGGDVRFQRGRRCGTLVTVRIPNREV